MNEFGLSVSLIKLCTPGLMSRVFANGLGD